MQQPIGRGSLVLASSVEKANTSLHVFVLLKSGTVLDLDATCDAYSQLGVNAAIAGGSRLGPLASLGLGEMLSCGQMRFSALELSPVVSDPAEGLTTIE